VYLQPLLRKAPKASEFGEIMQLLRCSRSFKVTDFGTNRKTICDFLLVINSNLPSILHRFQVTADYFASDRRVLHFNTLAGDDPLRISP